MAKNKLPKKIAGLKVPRMVRKSPVIRSLLGSATGRQTLADALVAGAAAASAVLVAKNSDGITETGKDVAKGTGKARKLAINAFRSAAGAMSGVIGDAAHAVLPADAPKGRRSRLQKQQRADAKSIPAHH